jgi:hypothetical protein
MVLIHAPKPLTPANAKRRKHDRGNQAVIIRAAVIRAACNSGEPTVVDSNVLFRGTRSPR